MVFVRGCRWLAICMPVGSLMAVFPSVPRRNFARSLVLSTSNQLCKPNMHAPFCELGNRSCSRFSKDSGDLCTSLAHRFIATRDRPASVLALGEPQVYMFIFLRTPVNNFCACKHGDCAQIFPCPQIFCLQRLGVTIQSLRGISKFPSVTNLSLQRETSFTEQAAASVVQLPRLGKRS